MLITVSDGKLKLWNFASNWTCDRESNLASPTIRCVAVNSDSTQVAVGTFQTVQFLKTEDLSVQGESLHFEGYVNILSFSSDNKKLLIATDKQCQVWDCEEHRVLSKLEIGDRFVRSAIFNEDGNEVLLEDSFGRVFRHDVTSGKCKAEHLRENRKVRHIAFHPNARTALVVTSDGQAQLADLSTGRFIGPPRSHFGGICQVAFSRRVPSFVTTIPSNSKDGPGRDIAVWPLPQEIQGDVALLKASIEKTTGMKLDPDGVPVLLAPEEWNP